MTYILLESQKNKYVKFSFKNFYAIINCRCLIECMSRSCLIIYYNKESNRCRLSVILSSYTYLATENFDVYWANLSSFPDYILATGSKTAVGAVSYCSAYGSYLPLPVSLKQINKFKSYRSGFFTGKTYTKNVSLCKLKNFFNNEKFQLHL